MVGRKPDSARPMSRPRFRVMHDLKTRARRSLRRWPRRFRWPRSSRSYAHAPGLSHWCWSALANHQCSVLPILRPCTRKSRSLEFEHFSSRDSTPEKWLKPGAWGKQNERAYRPKRRGHLRKLRRALVLRSCITRKRGRDIGLAESGFRPAVKGSSSTSRLFAAAIFAW
jgi:hypothetical protein